MNRALVLSGGSIKGAFQAGVISYLLQSGYVPNSVYGVSVGSLNGAFLAERAGRAEKRLGITSWPRIGKELEHFWKTKITSPRKLGKKRIFRALLGLVFKNFNGLMDPRPLHDLVYREFKRHNIQRSPIKYSVGVVDLISGEYITKPNTHPQIINYILASTALPLMMPVQLIQNQHLLDGGLRNIAPLKQAIDDGATEITCVLTYPEDISRSKFDPGKPLHLIERISEIVISEIVMNDIARAQNINKHCPKNGQPVKEGPFKGYRYIPIKIIRPKQSLDVSIGSFTARDIHNLLILGELTAKAVA